MIEFKISDDTTNKELKFFVDNIYEELLAYFIKSQNIELAKYLIDNKKTNINFINIYHENFLYLAYEYTPELIKYLIEHGIDVNLLDGYCETILHKAARDNNLKLAKYLVEQHNADVNIYEYNSEMLPAELALCEGNIELAKYLVEHGTDVNKILDTACWLKNSEFIKYLIEEKKADVNTKDANGENILFTVIKSSKPGLTLELIKYLVEEKKLDVNIKNNNGETILFNACKSGNFELVKYLIEEKKLDVNIKDNEGVTILTYLKEKIKENTNTEKIQYLLDLLIYLVSVGAKESENTKSAYDLKYEDVPF